MRIFFGPFDRIYEKFDCKKNSKILPSNPLSANCHFLKFPNLKLAKTSGLRRLTNSFVGLISHRALSSGAHSLLLQSERTPNTKCYHLLWNIRFIWSRRLSNPTGFGIRFAWSIRLNLFGWRRRGLVDILAPAYFLLIGPRCLFLVFIGDCLWVLKFNSFNFRGFELSECLLQTLTMGQVFQVNCRKKLLWSF
jgi:hypothetical protein